MMNSKLRRAAGAGLISLVALACGGAPTGSGLPSGLPSSLPSGMPTMPPIEVPSGSLIPDQALEDLFPDTIGGNPIEPQSAQGQSVLALLNEDDPTAFNEFLSSINTTIDQVSAAFSFNIWPGATATDFTGLTMTAFRVRNVPAANVVTGIVEMVREDVDNATVAPATVSGKAVTAITNPEDAEETVYVYATGDVVFIVGGTPAHVEETFSQLP